VKKYLLLCLLLTISITAIDISNQDISKINQQNSKILLQEENRLKFLKNKEQQSALRISKNYYTIDKNTSNNKNCFNINSIQIFDNYVVSKEEFSPILKKYQNQCLNQKKIQNLINEINNKYIKEGYITTQAYLKAQDLSTKILKIFVQEGKIENIQINDKNSTETDITFPNHKNKVLNLRDIEMGLEHFNRLNTTSTTLDLKEGSKNGYSLVNIHKEQDKKIYTTLSINNNGSESTGKESGNIQIYLENLFNLNSQLSLNLSGTLKQLDEKRTIGRSYSWNIPYGYNLFSIGYREFLYRSTIIGENSKYVSSGVNSTHFYNLDHTFFRDDKTILKLSTGLEIKQNVNFIANQVIKTSSNKLTVGTVSLGGSSSIADTSLYGTLSLKKGLPWFDSFNNSDRPQKALFTAETLNLSAYTNLNFFNLPFTLSNSLSAQYSNDKLYNTELFSIGGLYSVRGFKYMAYSGEIGAYLRNDLSYSSRQKLFGQTVLLNPFIGYDLGVVEYDKDIYKYMVGSAIGLKIQHQFLSADFTLGIPLYAYDPIAEEETTLSFSLQYQY